MNRAELIKAFEMRLDGRQYKEIGLRLGYDETSVSKALKAAVSREYQKIARCKYPEIAKYLWNLGWEVKDLAGKINYSYGYILQVLKGGSSC